MKKARAKKPSALELDRDQWKTRCEHWQAMHQGAMKTRDEMATRLREFEIKVHAREERQANDHLVAEAAEEAALGRALSTILDALIWRAGMGPRVNLDGTLRSKFGLVRHDRS